MLCCCSKHLRRPGGTGGSRLGRVTRKTKRGGHIPKHKKKFEVNDTLARSGSLYNKQSGERGAMRKTYNKTYRSPLET